MLRQTMVAALVAGGLAMGAGAFSAAQAAVPMAKIQAGDPAKSDVIQVQRKGGGGLRGGGMRGGGFGNFRGGGFRGGPFSPGGGFRAYGGRRNFGGWGGGRRHYGGWNRGWNRGYHRRRYGYRRFYGPSIYFGTGYGYRGCGYLRRRAVVTGSRYWWRRYNRCRYGW